MRGELEMVIKIVIDGDCVPKARPRLCKFGVYTPKTTVDYERKVKSCAIEAMGNKLTSDSPIKLDGEIYVGIPKSSTKRTRELMLNGGIKPIKKPDIDNCIKTLMDALNGVVYFDDKQVVSVRFIKEYDINPRVELKVIEL